jgi:hypothetical protein
MREQKKLDSHYHYSGLIRNRESERLDLQELRPSEEPVEINAECVCGQFGIHSGPQAPEGVGMVDFDVELVGKLRIHALHSLAKCVEQLVQIGRQLLVLVAPRQGTQPNPLGLPYLRRFRER